MRRSSRPARYAADGVDHDVPDYGWDTGFRGATGFNSSVVGRTVMVVVRGRTPCSMSLSDKERFPGSPFKDAAMDKVVYKNAQNLFDFTLEA